MRKTSSFGLVLYEMATGRRAFNGETAEELQSAILNQVPPPVQDLRPDLPAELRGVLHKALEKDRERRHQSAAALRAEMTELSKQFEHGPVARNATGQLADDLNA